MRVGRAGGQAADPNCDNPRLALLADIEAQKERKRKNPDAPCKVEYEKMLDELARKSGANRAMLHRWAVKRRRKFREEQENSGPTAAPVGERQARSGPSTRARPDRRS